MEYKERKSDDIDQLFPSGGGWDSSYIQLSGGKLGFATRQYFLPEMLIEWNEFGQSVLFRDALQDDAIFLGFVLQTTAAPVYHGRELSPCDALMFLPNREHEYRVASATRSLVIGLSGNLVRELGWDIRPLSIRQIPQDDLTRLIWVCSQACSSTYVIQGDSISEPSDWGIRDRILVALRQAIAPWMASEGGHHDSESRAFEIVKKARQWMVDQQVDLKLSVPQMASELNVSQRTLFESFRVCYGLGPYEFSLKHRLHGFRKELLTGEPHRGKISKIATSLGFQHHSRLAQRYKAQFGETPRQTMKRRLSQ